MYFGEGEKEKNVFWRVKVIEFELGNSGSRGYGMGSMYRIYQGN